MFEFESVQCHDMHASIILFLFKCALNAWDTVIGIYNQVLLFKTLSS